MYVNRVVLVFWNFSNPFYYRFLRVHTCTVLYLANSYDRKKRHNTLSRQGYRYVFWAERGGSQQRGRQARSQGIEGRYVKNYKAAKSANASI